MKNKPLKLMKIVFVSYEFFITILIILMFLFIKSPFAKIGYYLSNTKVIFELLNIYMAGLLLFSLTYGWKILKPRENNRTLYQWDNYWEIKMTVFVSLFIILICVILYYFTFVFKSNLENENLALLTLLAIINSLITVISLVLAAFKINEILDANT